DDARLVQAFAERRHVLRRALGRPEADVGDHRQRARLGACGQGQARGANEQCDEITPPHSITSSASASNVGGTSRPSALAVLRLMTDLNLVACSTGISPGLAPLRILSTNAAARRNITEKSTP